MRSFIVALIGILLLVLIELIERGNMTGAEMLFGTVSILSSVVIILGGYIMKGLVRRVCKVEEEVSVIKSNYIDRFEKLTKVVTDNKDEIKDLITTHIEKDNLNHLSLLKAIHESRQ